MGTDFDLDGGLIARCVTAGEGKRQDYETCTMVVQSSSGVNYAHYAHDYAHDRITDPSGVCPALTKQAHVSGNLNVAADASEAVRRLTVEECEALQGFPRKYTAIPWRGKTASECPDGPRYRALGNSWAVPVVAWIGKRIAGASA